MNEEHLRLLYLIFFHRHHMENKPMFKARIRGLRIKDADEDPSMPGVKDLAELIRHLGELGCG